MSNYCVCCGEEIPEGRMVCPLCEFSYSGNADERKSCDMVPGKAQPKKTPCSIKRIIQCLCARRTK